MLAAASLLTARYADRWNTFGGYDITDDEEFYDKTAQRSRFLDAACEPIGRDPRKLGRSVLVGTFHATGKRIPLRVCEVVRVQNDEIVSLHLYWDNLGFMNEIAGGGAS